MTLLEAFNQDREGPHTSKMRSLHHSLPLRLAEYRGQLQRHTYVLKIEGSALQVIPELQAGPNSQPILQADALKFVTIFRSQLPKASLLAIFPQLVALLKSESNVVHSYAAILIERLLASKVRHTCCTPFIGQDKSAYEGNSKAGLSIRTDMQ